MINRIIKCFEVQVSKNRNVCIVVTALLLLGATARAQQLSSSVVVLDPYFPGDTALSWKEVGQSVEGRPIYAVEFGDGSEITLVFGGFHGNEFTAVGLALLLCREMPDLVHLIDGHRIVIVPILNPDGYIRGTRANARGVDINRNFPTRNWGDVTLRKRDYPGPTPASEPETRVAVDLIQHYTPAKILSIHDPLYMNNYDGGQSEALARAMAAHNGYPVKGDIGYPTPGSFGTWAGVERVIPMVTLEIPPGDLQIRWEENRQAIIAAVCFPVRKP